ncbi:Hypothetical protein PSEBR_m754 [Pseudomonas brassicacearum subsp. brassicacearum NFM421]|uniref:Nucleoid-structuring protein H-NS n=1 Tax=Pseudomonas brassicacearum (strain NFM421) TaxID=994484 RepID=F2KFA3_PSEBN|nr:Hypothetical protein PSEBR_m754 [Pseudomonas brassicacearum subsp. brassicacearum NFM421]
MEEPGAGPAKSNQKRLAPPLGTSPRLGVPSLRHCPVGRREGPSMAQRGYLGIHAEVPTPQCLRSASVVNGAPRSKSKAKQEPMWLNHRHREQARSHNGPAVNTRLKKTQDPLWERACSR